MCSKYETHCRDLEIKIHAAYAHSHCAISCPYQQPKFLWFCSGVVVPGEQTVLSSFPPFFSLSLSSTCSSSFFFYLLFHYICFIKHSLSTSYVLETVLGCKDSRTGKAQTVPEKHAPKRGKAGGQMMTLKEDMYTREGGQRTEVRNG